MARLPAVDNSVKPVTRGEYEFIREGRRLFLFVAFIYDAVCFAAAATIAVATTIAVAASVTGAFAGSRRNVAAERRSFSEHL